MRVGTCSPQSQGKYASACRVKVYKHYLNPNFSNSGLIAAHSDERKHIAKPRNSLSLSQSCLNSSFSQQQLY